MLTKLRNKRQWARQLAKLQQVKTWQLIVMLLLVTLAAAIFLRMNNQNMIEHRQAVLVADEKGDPAKIKSSLVDLQHYVSHHMNTDLGSGVYLQESYKRASRAAVNQAREANNDSGAAYRQAADECQNNFTGGTSSFRTDYVQCVVNKTTGLDDPQTKLNLPNNNLYRYSYASPAWSLDLAGFFVALMALLILVIVIKIVYAIVLRLLLRWHFRDV